MTPEKLSAILVEQAHCVAPVARQMITYISDISGVATQFAMTLDEVTDYRLKQEEEGGLPTLRIDLMDEGGVRKWLITFDPATGQCFNRLFQIFDNCTGHSLLVEELNEKLDLQDEAVICESWTKQFEQKGFEIPMMPGVVTMVTEKGKHLVGDIAGHEWLKVTYRDQAEKRVFEAGQFMTAKPAVGDKPEVGAGAWWAKHFEEDPANAAKPYYIMHSGGGGQMQEVKCYKKGVPPDMQEKLALAFPNFEIDLNLQPPHAFVNPEVAKQ
ncbi:hypothetical protein ACFL1U_02275 [Patescibacteria group bacterium]